MYGKVMLFLGLAALVVSMSVGLYMGLAEDHRLAGAHTHLNLVGGVLMCVFGLFYLKYPDAENFSETQWQVITHVIAAVVLPGGIALIALRGPQYGPVAGIGGGLALLAVLLFARVAFKLLQRPVIR